MNKIDYKKRAKELADDNIKLITDNVFLKLENKELTEQLRLCGVTNQREMLLSGICQYTNKNTQTEIVEVEDWIKNKYLK